MRFRLKLHHDAEGNVLIVAAITIPVLLALMGLAVDFQHTVSQKSRMQQALDSGVLHGAVMRQTGLSEAVVRQEVQNYIIAQSKDFQGGLTCSTTLVTFDTESEDLTGTIECDQPTLMSSMIGHDKMEFDLKSTSTYGVGKIDVAFVFDVSGSMNSNNRLPLLKTAAKDAFDILLPDDKPNDGSVRLSIVTYNNAVNAGAYFNDITRERILTPETSNSQGRIRYSAYNGDRLIDTVTGERFFYYEDSTCLDSTCGQYSDYDWDVARRLFSADIGSNTCVAERIGDEAYTDTAPTLGDEVTAGNPRWNFYTNDRNKYYGEREVETGGANSYGTGAFTGRFALCQSSGPVPLTKDKAVLKAHVDSLTANGGTAGHIGVAWGWYLVSPNWAGVWPTVSAPLSYNEPDASKVVILMTDGDFNTNHPEADDTSFEQAKALCDQMKSAPAEVQVYTIGFQVPSSVQKTSSGETILEYCATSPDHAFDADNGNELIDAYANIARSISELRLSQ